MRPSIGRIVHYKLDDGKLVPAIITKVWNEVCVNLRVFMDSKEIDHTTSVMEGEDVGQWVWPERRDI